MVWEACIAREGRGVWRSLSRVAGWEAQLEQQRSGKADRQLAVLRARLAWCVWSVVGRFVVEEQSMVTRRRRKICG